MGEKKQMPGWRQASVIGAENRATRHPAGHATWDQITTKSVRVIPAGAPVSSANWTASEPVSEPSAS